MNLPESIDVAFKEWAGICRALAEGRQTLILRKGGIADPGGVVRPEYPSFWMFPTHFHEGGESRSTEGPRELSHFAVVQTVQWIDRLDQALRLRPFHGWDDATIESRFHYRRPGLTLFVVRLFAMETPHRLEMVPAYDGCRTWVPLTQPYSTSGARPVLNEEQFTSVSRQIQAILTD